MAECCYAASRFPNSLSRGTCKIKRVRADRNYNGFFLLSIRGTFVLVCEIDKSALTELPLTFSLKETTQSPNLIIPIRSAGVTRATLIRRKRIFLTNAKNQETPNSLHQIGQKRRWLHVFRLPKFYNAFRRIRSTVLRFLNVRKYANYFSRIFSFILRNTLRFQGKESAP